MKTRIVPRSMLVAIANRMKPATQLEAIRDAETLTALNDRDLIQNSATSELRSGIDVNGQVRFYDEDNEEVLLLARRQ
jgi:hypothetical protein